MNKNKNLAKIFLIGAILVTVGASFLSVKAQTSIKKDSDLDGISNEAEVNIYKTDPNKADTDGDDVMDYQEILDKTNPLDPNSKVNTNTNDKQIFWFIGRVAGISAFIMFTVVVVFGLLMTSKFLLKFRFLSAPNALETHSFNASFIALTLVVIHLSAFLFDSVLHLTLKEALVPFAVKRDLKSALGFDMTIPIAQGIFAFYLAIILVVTSRLRKKLVPVKIWRAIHYTSFLFYILFLAHGILIGTDTKEPWMIAIYATSGITVLSLILLRIFGRKYFINSVRPTIQAPVASQPLVAPTESTQPAPTQQV